MTDWNKYEVECAHCKSRLMRRLYRPKDMKKIDNFFCSDKPCKAEWQRSLKPLTREALVRLYIVDGKSANQIAREVGRNSKRVWEWLRDYGIDRHPRGKHPNSGFKRGHKKGLRRPYTAEMREKLRQARIRDGSKGLFKNGVHVLKGRTGERHPRYKGGCTPERQAFYASVEWKTACVEVWHRADARCERCGKDHRTIPVHQRGSFHVHHIVSFAVRELRADPSNLALLCRCCHLYVHSNKNTLREFIRDVA